MWGWGDGDEWAEVRRLHFAEGMGIKAIARRLGVARTTVRSVVRSSDPPRYERRRRASAVDAFEPEIRTLLNNAVRSLAEERAAEIAAQMSALPAGEGVDALAALLTPAG